MVYLVACLLERLFGKDTIDDIEGIKGNLSISDIIDGVSVNSQIQDVQADERQATEEYNEDVDYAEGEGEDETDEFFDGDDGYDGAEEAEEAEDSQPIDPPNQPKAPSPLKPTVTHWLSSNFSTQPSTASPATTTSAFSAPPAPSGAFGNLVATPNVFGNGSVFGGSVFAPSNPAPVSVFGNLGTPTHQSVLNVFPSTSAPTAVAAPPIQPQPQATFSSSPFSGTSNGFPTKAPEPSSAQAPAPSLFGKLS